MNGWFSKPVLKTGAERLLEFSPDGQFLLGIQECGKEQNITHDINLWTTFTGLTDSPIWNASLGHRNIRGIGFEDEYPYAAVAVNADNGHNNAGAISFQSSFFMRLLNFITKRKYQAEQKNMGELIWLRMVGVAVKKYQLNKRRYEEKEKEIRQKYTRPFSFTENHINKERFFKLLKDNRAIDEYVCKKIGIKAPASEEALSKYSSQEIADVLNAILNDENFYKEQS